MSQEIRVRFAPSPTGYLHVGGARTALYSYLFAKQQGGCFVLRVEDTDQERSSEQSLLSQVKDLKWLGLHWDEGVAAPSSADSSGDGASTGDSAAADSGDGASVGDGASAGDGASTGDGASGGDGASPISEFGDFGPYRQSLRLSVYKEYADRLLNENKAYYCFLSDEEIEQQRQDAAANSLPYQIKSPYRDFDLKASQKRLDAGEKAVVRFKTPHSKKDYHLNDLVRGNVTFPSDMVGDFVLLRSSGMPVYNFCCAIDDFLMKMSHVFRAEEHLSNTLRQMMIYEAFNWKQPKFGHLSLILGEDRQKLSKRHGAVSVGHFREQGYLPEALVNFLSLLGWSSPQAQEFLSMDELLQQFSTERLNSAGAVFDNKKLLWMNAHYLRNLDHQVLWQKIEPLLAAEKMEFSQDNDWRDRALSVIKTSMETLLDAVELFRPLSENHFEVCKEQSQEVLDWETSPQVIAKWIELVSNEQSPYMSEERFITIQKQIKSECSVKGKQLFMPIRVAVIGKPHGAELKQLVPLIKKDVLLKRASSLGF